jgi:dihydrofolate reductase
MNQSTGRTVYYAAASFDGYIAEVDDSLDWLFDYDGSYEGGEPSEGSYESFFNDVGALVMGSATYEVILQELATGFRPEWPYEARPTWILTSRELPRPAGAEDHVRMFSGPVGDVHEEMLAAAAGRHLWVVGGGNVASQFAEAGLLDEVLVNVVPVVLGDGKRLFERRLPRPMQLTRVRPFENGMVELRYRLDGVKR